MSSQGDRFTMVKMMQDRIYHRIRDRKENTHRNVRVSHGEEAPRVHS
jgi:hypothetical protein